jgi:cardiolipin synthase
MGGGIMSIDSAMEQVVGGAEREILVLAYAIGSGGVGFVDLVRERLADGVSASIIVNRMQSQDREARERLIHLSRTYSRSFNLFEYLGDGDDHLHAKLVIADRSRALVGSANLSWHGFVANHELSVLVEGEAVSHLAAAVDRLKLYHRVHRLTPGPS